MLKNFLRLLPVMAFALAAALPAPAAAAGGGGGTPITVSIGAAKVQSKILVTVPVTIQCAAPLAGQPLGFGEVNVFIEQAYGKSVSHGSGGVVFFFCPASPQTVDVIVTPDLYPTPSTAFHGGRAIGTANAFAQDPTGTVFGSGAIGPIPIKL